MAEQRLTGEFEPKPLVTAVEQSRWPGRIVTATTIALAVAVGWFAYSDDGNDSEGERSTLDQTTDSLNDNFPSTSSTTQELESAVGPDIRAIDFQNTTFPAESCKLDYMWDNSYPIVLRDGQGESGHPDEVSPGGLPAHARIEQVHEPQYGFIDDDRRLDAIVPIDCSSIPDDDPTTLDAITLVVPLSLNGSGELEIVGHNLQPVMGGDITDTTLITETDPTTVEIEQTRPDRQGYQTDSTFTSTRSYRADQWFDEVVIIDPES